MADSKEENVADVQEITDEMKEKLLLNLFKDSIKEPSSQPAVDGAQPCETSASNVVDGPPEAETKEGLNPPDGHTQQQRPERPPDAAQSEFQLAQKRIVELEDKLKGEEDGLSTEQLEERYKNSQSLKAEANNLYKDSLFADAAEAYSKALLLCPLSETKSRSVLYANRAAALMGENTNQPALADLNRALELDPNYLKALERRARLNKALDNLDDSLKDYEKLLEMKPKHCEYMTNIHELRERIRVRNEEMKEKVIGSLKQLGNVFLKPFGLSTDNFKMVPNENGGYNLQMGG